MVFLWSVFCVAAIINSSSAHGFPEYLGWHSLNCIEEQASRDSAWLTGLTGLTPQLGLYDTCLSNEQEQYFLHRMWSKLNSTCKISNAKLSVRRFYGGNDDDDLVSEHFNEFWCLFNL
jgi:hypothetical protein